MHTAHRPLIRPIRHSLPGTGPRAVGLAEIAPPNVEGLLDELNPIILEERSD